MQPVNPVLAANASRGLVQVNVQAQGFELALQHLAAGLVNLPGHKARGKLHHVGFGHAQIEQGFGGFQAQQAAPQHGPHAGSSRCRLDFLQVLDGAVHHHPGFLHARNVGHEGRRAGGQYQIIVVLHQAAAGVHRLAGPVNFLHGIAQVQGNMIVGVPLPGGHQ